MSSWYEPTSTTVGHRRTCQAVPDAVGLGRDSQGQPEARLSLPMARATGMLTL